MLSWLITSKTFLIDISLSLSRVDPDDPDQVKFSKLFEPGQVWSRSRLQNEGALNSNSPPDNVDDHGIESFSFEVSYETITQIKLMSYDIGLDPNDRCLQAITFQASFRPKFIFSGLISIK